MDYKTSGVDVEAGRAFIDRIRSSVEDTHRSEVIGGLGGFGGFFRMPKGFQKPVLVSGTDGVGTKLELAQDYQSHFSVGVDLVAMCVNDVITSGAEPLFFLDYIATGSLSPKALTEVIEGIAYGCSVSGCSLLGGETAEMPGFYSKGRYDLAGFCVGAVEEPDLVTGQKIQAGDQIIGILSSGIHSNGFSLVRKILSLNKVNQETRYGSGQKLLIEALLKPTKLYFPVIKALLDAHLPLLGMSNITGGGLPENLPRCLPKNLIAYVDTESWEQPSIFKWLQQAGEVPEADLWNTFNLGVGFCLVVSSDFVKPVIEICSEKGFSAWPLGIVQESTKASSSRIEGLPI